MNKERAFGKKLNELVKKAHSLEEAGVKRVIKLLSQARKDVAAQVASTEWQAHYLPQFKGAVERALQEFGDKYNVQMREMQRDFWEQGVDMVDLPLRTVGIAAAIPEVDITALSIMQDFSADLIKGLSRSATERINREITLGLLGQKTSFEVMQGIGRNLKGKSIFTSIAARAETITRTELGRVFSAATQARYEKAAEVVPGLMKQWRHATYVRMPRSSHVAIDGQVRPVKEPFDVGGEKLMYPRDPNGSAQNTIKCHCYVVPYHPDWEEAVGNKDERQAA